MTVLLYHISRFGALAWRVAKLLDPKLQDLNYASSWAKPTLPEGS